MRANAPFPVLLALTGIVSLIGLIAVPATLLASPLLRQPMRSTDSRNARLSPSHRSSVKQRKSARVERPERKHVEAARRESTKRHVVHPVAGKPKRETAATRRVHAWVREQGKPGESGTPAPAPTKATMAEAKSPAASAEVMGTLDAATPAPVAALPATADLAAEPVILPTLYNKRGRLIVPPALKGSHEILVHQNLMADSDGLTRIQDDDDLTKMRNAGALVAIPANTTLHVDERLPVNRRFCRPWTALFLETLARQHYARFQTPLQVNSAVRTVEFQQKLIHTNGNAAPAEGDTASPHLTGQAVDIAKHGLTMAEIAWLRGYLLPLVQQGKVDVEEEFQQSCFHISVYKKYMPSGLATRRVIATTHREGADVLGMSLR
jgi:hypothetical protein